jgi:acyl carrier protein
LTATEIEDLLIELLATYLNQDPSTLRGALLAKGNLMPVDSLDLFDILQEFRQRTGLRLPVRELHRDTMRSVRAFAAFVEQRAQS